MKHMKKLTSETFICYVVHLRFHFSLSLSLSLYLVQSKVIGDSRFGYYYFIRMFYSFLLLSREHEQNRIYKIDTVTNIMKQYVQHWISVNTFLFLFLFFNDRAQVAVFCCINLISFLFSCLFFALCSFCLFISVDHIDRFGSHDNFTRSSQFH